jgi:hypothetical protein
MSRLLSPVSVSHVLACSAWLGLGNPSLTTVIDPQVGLAGLVSTKVDFVQVGVIGGVNPNPNTRTLGDRPASRFCLGDKFKPLHRAEHFALGEFS